MRNVYIMNVMNLNREDAKNAKFTSLWQLYNSIRRYICALNDHILWFLRKRIFFCPLSRKNISFLCELCVLSKAGGEKTLGDVVTLWSYAGYSSIVSDLRDAIDYNSSLLATDPHRQSQTKDYIHCPTGQQSINCQRLLRNAANVLPLSIQSYPY